MKLALFSDVHANLPALNAVLADIDLRHPDATYHLGDLIGYGSAPNEVVECIRFRGLQGVSGNYDSTVSTGYKHCGCRYENPEQEALAHAAYQSALQQTTAANKRWLAQLPFRIDLRPLGGHVPGPTVTLIHGNHVLNTVYVTADRPDAFLQGMAAAAGARAGDVVCFGHTHIAWDRVVNGVHFVNTGSVGRPKDGDPRAGYVILDVSGERVEAQFLRVEY